VSAPLPGDSVRAIYGAYVAVGTVRRVTSRTLHVWFGDTGWGQRAWAFSSRDGSARGNTIAHRPTARLDLSWRSPFSGHGETDPASVLWEDETRDCLSLAAHGRTRDNEV
jgi:hypothetical protein